MVGSFSRVLGLCQVCPFRRRQWAPGPDARDIATFTIKPCGSPAGPGWLQALATSQDRFAGLV